MILSPIDGAEPATSIWIGFDAFRMKIGDKNSDANFQKNGSGSGSGRK